MKRLSLGPRAPRVRDKNSRESVRGQRHARCTWTRVIFTRSLGYEDDYRAVACRPLYMPRQRTRKLMRPSAQGADARRRRRKPLRTGSKRGFQLMQRIRATRHSLLLLTFNEPIFRSKLQCEDALRCCL